MLSWFNFIAHHFKSHSPILLRLFSVAFAHLNWIHAQHTQMFFTQPTIQSASLHWSCICNLLVWNGTNEERARNIAHLHNSQQSNEVGVRQTKQLMISFCFYLTSYLTLCIVAFGTHLFAEFAVVIIFFFFFRSFHSFQWCWIFSINYNTKPMHNDTIFYVHQRKSLYAR